MASGVHVLQALLCLQSQKHTWDLLVAQNYTIHLFPWLFRVIIRQSLLTSLNLLFYVCFGVLGIR